MDAFLALAGAFVAGAMIVAIVAYLLYRQTLRAHGYQLIAARAEGRREAQEDADRSAKDRVDSLTVTVEPYVKTIRESKFIWKETTVEIGYQYQLFLREIPILEPHRVVTEHVREKVIDEKGFERLRDYAYQLATLAVAKTGAAGKIISVASAKILKRK